MEAYVYFYPLLSMDVAREQFTNIEAGKEFGKGPMNMFVNIPEYPPADFKGVVRPNFDTLYSVAWLDAPVFLCCRRYAACGARQFFRHDRVTR